MASPQEAKACNMPKADIENVAGQLAEWSGFRPGQEIREVVRKLGGSVEYLRWEDWLTHDRDTIVVNGPRDFAIKLLGVDGPLRNNFTIAHEIGHYVLHSRMGKIAPMIAGRKGSTRVEWEANWFAAALLMPAGEFSEAARSVASDLQLAARFNVSMEAAQVRRKVLGV